MIVIAILIIICIPAFFFKMSEESIPKDTWRPDSGCNE